RRVSDDRRGGARGIRGDPAQGGRARPLASLDDRGRNVRGGALDGLDVPLLELQGVRLRPAASALDAARHGAERDDRGHAPRGLPLPHLRGVRGVGPDQAVHRRADACGAPRGPSRQGPSVSQGGHMDRVSTFVATSDIHLKYKLRKSRAEVLKAAVDAVRHAKGYCEDVEFSPEDASRSDFDYMCDVLSAVIEAGAKTINIPDTVGYAIPREWGERIARIREKVRGMEKVVLSVHCHNDLGQAVANSL